MGMQGTVTVAMTVEDGKITNVELTECHETPSIASVAMERLPQLMMEHQTTTLDNVTGATLASGAIMRAASAAAEAAGVEQAVCSCSEKCAAGAVNTECAVCSVNMEKCVGVEPEPTETQEPAPEEAEPETGGNTGMLLAVLAVALVGGGAAFYFKVLRPKQQKAAAPQEDYGDELTDYDEPDGYGDEDDDGPPWDEEDDDGEEADK